MLIVLSSVRQDSFIFASWSVDADYFDQLSSCAETLLMCPTLLSIAVICSKQGVLSRVCISVFHQACRGIAVLWLSVLLLSWVLCAEFHVTSVVSDYNLALNPSVYGDNGHL